MPQVVEHVTGANEGILRLLRDVVIKSPRGGKTLDFDDEDMPYLFYGGAGRLPPGFDEEPSGGQPDKEASLSGLESSVGAILDWYDTTNADLRQCALRHPAFGLFDGAQWLLFAAVHTQQHRGQLLDLKLAAPR